MFGTRLWQFGVGALVGAFCLFSYPDRVSSTTVLELDTDDLSVLADTILRGQVLGVESRWNESRTRIYTEYVLEIEEVLKGEASPHNFVVRQWGGIVGDRGYYIPGVATFAQNEDVFAFFTAENAATGTRFTVGLSQGKYSVRDELATGRKLLQRDLRGLTFYDETQETTYEPVLEDAPVYLEQMRDAVQRALDREHGK